MNNLSQLNSEILNPINIKESTFLSTLIFIFVLAELLY